MEYLITKGHLSIVILPNIILKMYVYVITIERNAISLNTIIQRL